MIRSIRRRPMRRAALLAAPMLLGACMTWGESAVPAPASAPAPERATAGSVRVTRHDGFQVVLAEAEVRGDSIVGIEQVRLRRMAVALADIDRVEARRVHALNSVLASVGVAATVFSAGVLALLAILSTDHS